MTEPRITPLNPVRMPPNSAEAEQALLGAVMISERAYDRIGDRILEQHFYREKHRLIWRTITELADERRHFDPVTVAEKMQHRGLSDSVDGGAYLTMLANETPGASQVEGWADIVIEKHLRRRLIEAGTTIADEAFNGDNPLEAANQTLSEIELPGTDALADVPQMARELIERMQQLADPDTQMLRTGLLAVDKRIKALFPGDLVIVAGRPGDGKTTYGMQIGWNLARAGAPVQVFQLEMERIQIYKRRVAAEDVSNERMKDPKTMTQNDWDGFMAAIAKTRKLPLYVDDTPALTIREIHLRARRAKRRHGIQVVIVDYLQLIEAGFRTKSREEVVAMASRGLKAMAKDLGVPVIAMAQLNRDVEKRQDKRPTMADLRESGQIEQDADIIQFLYFNGKHFETDDTGILEVITAKFRDGEPGKSYIGFRRERFQMVDADYETISRYKTEFEGRHPAQANSDKGFEL